MNDNSNKVIEVDINEILPNRFQPRIQFDEDEILELSDSIKEHGVIQPLVVRTIGDKYEIIAGERRYKASVLVGKETVPVIIKNLNDKESAEIALIENVQRKNLTPIEEAISYKKVLDMGYLTQEKLAKKIGKSQSSIANKIRLLNLSDEVQEALLDNKISERHARSLLRLKSFEDQNKILNKIIVERMPVRKTDDEIDNMLNMKESKEEKGEKDMNNGINENVNNIFGNVQQVPAMEMPAAPSFSVEPVASVPAMEMPAAPSFSVEPVASAPAMEMPAAPSFSVEPVASAPAMEMPAAPSFSVEPVASAPAMEMPAAPSFSVEPVASAPAMEMPAAPSFSVEPVASVPAMEMPAAPSFSVEPVASVPAMEMPAAPSFSVEPVASAPAMGMPAAPSFSVEPVASVPAMEMPAAPSFSVEPVASAPAMEMPAAPSFSVEPVASVPAMGMPAAPSFTVEPVASVPAMEMPAAPSFSVEPVASAPAIPETKPIIDSTEINTINENISIDPIIVTDYTKQYDPKMEEDFFKVEEKPNFKQVIELIRECSQKIEQLGYKLEMEEYDLSTIYQVVFKLEK